MIQNNKKGLLSINMIVVAAVIALAVLIIFIVLLGKTGTKADTFLNSQEPNNLMSLCLRNVQSDENVDNDGIKDDCDPCILVGNTRDINTKMNKIDGFHDNGNKLRDSNKGYSSYNYNPDEDSIPLDTLNRLDPDKDDIIGICDFAYDSHSGKNSFSKRIESECKKIQAQQDKAGIKVTIKNSNNNLYKICHIEVKE